MTTWQEKLKNKWWRLTHLYKIKDKQGRLVTFKPNLMQLRHLAERRNHRRNRILKARQFGFTTLYCIDMLDEALFVPGMSCAILNHKAQDLPKLFEIVKRGYENLPDLIKPITRTDTKNAYDFVTAFDGTPLDSSIYVASKVRGGTVQRLHITESAYVKDRQELVAGSMQAVPLTGSITEETTANGFNDFYDMFIESWNKPSYAELDYKGYFYPWHDNPEYSLPGVIDHEILSQKEKLGITLYGWSDGQILWRRWKMKELVTQQVGLGLSSEQLFMQEYPSSVMEAFQSGAGAVFDQEKVGELVPAEPLSFEEVTEFFTQKRAENDPFYTEEMYNKYVSLYKRGVTFWELPKFGQDYLIGVDPSDGEGADFGPIDVWSDTAQVAQYYGKTRPDELAELTAEIGWFYNTAYVGVENNMLSTMLFLSKIYDNYYFETKQDQKTLKRTKNLGWNTNSKSRDVMIDDFLVLFDEGNLTIRSKVTIGEMKTFVKNDHGKREHAVGKHDDALFAGFIAIQMRKLKPKKARVFATKPF